MKKRLRPTLLTICILICIFSINANAMQKAPVHDEERMARMAAEVPAADSAATEGAGISEAQTVDGQSDVLPDGTDFPEGTTVFDGKNYYDTMVDALKAVAGREGAVLYCKPDADVGSMTHGHVCASLTVYGNGAYVSGGEKDFELDTSTTSAHTDCLGLQSDIFLTINSLNCSGVWGQRTTAHALNIEFNDCANMHKIMFRSNITDDDIGPINITLNRCTFDGNGEGHKKSYLSAIHSIYDGKITINGCSFSNVQEAVNISHKTTGNMNVIVKDSAFNNCGIGTADNMTYAAPIRLVAAAASNTTLSVEGCTFTYGDGQSSSNGDILLGDGRTGKDSYPVLATIVNTEANVQIQKPGDRTEDKNDAEKVQVEASSIPVEVSNAAAKVGARLYETLSDAITAAQDGDTVTLLNDVDLGGDTKDRIRIEHAITLDLNGCTITESGVWMLGVFSDVTIKDSSNGKGQIINTNNAGTVIAVLVQEMNPTGKTSKLTIEGGVLTSTNAVDSYGVFSNPNGSDGTYGPTIVVKGGTIEGGKTGLTVTHDSDLTISGGTITGGDFAVSGNGERHNTKIRITGGTLKQTSKLGQVIFHPQNGELTIEGGTFNGTNTGVEMRAGALNITGGTFTGGMGEPRSQKNDNGSTTFNTAVAVAQHTTKLPITVNITGGTFTGGAAFYESDPNGIYEADSQVKKPVVTLAGGTFTGAISSADCQKFITGGTYDTDPTGYTADGYTVTDNQNGTWMVKKVSSSSGGGSSDDDDDDTSSGTTTETEKHPDGSSTTTVTRPDGSKTETTKRPDGSKEVVETKKDGTTTTTTTDQTGNRTETVAKPDGSSTTKVENKDGSSSTTAVTPDGRVEAEVKLPAGVLEQDGEEKTPVALPMPQVPVTSDRERAPAVTVDLPKDSSAKVEIPVEDVTAGTVAVLVKADGTEEVIKATVMTENGVAVTLSDGETVKIVDNAAHFVDVADTHWGAGAVDFATSRELFSGTSETTFSPEVDMTRAMILTVLARYEGVDTAAGATWHEAGTAWAVEQGISDGTNLTASVTREQLALMLYRYAGSPASTGSMTDFPDSASVSGWAVEAMTWAVESGLISGNDMGALNPQGTASRVEVAAMLSRFIAYTA